MFAIFRLAFAAASFVSEISLAAWNNSPDHYAKGTAVTPSQNLRFMHRAPTACKPIGFRFYFTPLTGVLFNFPSRYLFTIGRLLVFSLRRWFSRILAWFHLSGDTWAKNKEVNKLFAYETVTRSGRPFQVVQLNLFNLPPWIRVHDVFAHNTSDTTSRNLTYRRFRLFRFRSPLLTESHLLSLPEVTKMFQFTSFAS